MDKKKRAWAYCAIDAPEDTHDALKEQRQQLMDYAEQMGFEVVGSSSDTGYIPLWERAGFLHFVEVVQTGRTDILLIMNQNCLTHSSMQLQALTENYGIEVYSPLLGVVWHCQ